MRSLRLAGWLAGIWAGLLLCVAFIAAPAPFWILGGLILLAWWRLYPRRIEAISRQSTKRLYSDGRNVGMLGPHVVSFDDEWLSEITSDREVRTRWRAVEKAALTPEHLFLYVSGFSAVIVPLRAFATAEERTAFIGEAQSRAIETADGKRTKNDP